ncbi:MAG: hypothetical protein MHM6MM_008655 [Cercozoa sp. M6MM]
MAAPTFTQLSFRADTQTPVLLRAVLEERARVDPSIRTDQLDILVDELLSPCEQVRERSLAEWRQLSVHQWRHEVPLPALLRVYLRHLCLQCRMTQEDAEVNWRCRNGASVAAVVAAADLAQLLAMGIAREAALEALFATQSVLEAADLCFDPAARSAAVQQARVKQGLSPVAPVYTPPTADLTVLDKFHTDCFESINDESLLELFHCERERHEKLRQVAIENTGSDAGAADLFRSFVRGVCAKVRSSGDKVQLTSRDLQRVTAEQRHLDLPDRTALETIDITIEEGAPKQQDFGDSGPDNWLTVEDVVDWEEYPLDQCLLLLPCAHVPVSARTASQCGIKPGGKCPMCQVAIQDTVRLCTKPQDNISFQSE